MNILLFSISLILFLIILLVLFTPIDKNLNAQEKNSTDLEVIDYNVLCPPLDQFLPKHFNDECYRSYALYSNDLDGCDLIVEGEVKNNCKRIIREGNLRIFKIIENETSNGQCNFNSDGFSESCKEECSLNDEEFNDDSMNAHYLCGETLMTTVRSCYCF